MHLEPGAKRFPIRRKAAGSPSGSCGKRTSLHSEHWTSSGDVFDMTKEGNLSSSDENCKLVDPHY